MSRSGDQLGVERGRVSQIADRSAVETATGHRTAVGDPHNSNGLELQLVPQFELRVAPGVEEHLTIRR